MNSENDLKQYFPAVLGGAAKHLKEFSWDLWVFFVIIHFLINSLSLSKNRELFYWVIY